MAAEPAKKPGDEPEGKVERAADEAVEDVIEFFTAGGEADSPVADADAPAPPG